MGAFLASYGGPSRVGQLVISADVRSAEKLLDRYYPADASSFLVERQIVKFEHRSGGGIHRARDDHGRRNLAWINSN